MNQLTKDFTYAELKCPCGKCDGGSLDVGALTKLQALRDYCGFPLFVDSGCRCTEHNAAVGGKPGSYHLKGEAFDLKADTREKRLKIKEGANKVGFHGIGVGRNFIHVDIRKNPASWVYSDR